MCAHAMAHWDTQGRLVKLEGRKGSETDKSTGTDCCSLSFRYRDDSEQNALTIKRNCIEKESLHSNSNAVVLVLVLKD